MSDAVSRDPAVELPGFFGAEQAQPTEEIEPETWAKIDDYLARNPGGRGIEAALGHAIVLTCHLPILPRQVHEHRVIRIQIGCGSCGSTPAPGYQARKGSVVYVAVPMPLRWTC